MRYQAKGPKPLRLTMPTNHLITSNATMKEITKPTPISLQRTIPDVSWSRYLKSSSVDAPSMVGMARKKLYSAAVRRSKTKDRAPNIVVQIARATCGESRCQYVRMSGGGVSLKNRIQD